MESHCAPCNETNGPYLYRSKQNKILVFKKNISHKLASAWYGYKCETIHRAGFLISVSGSDMPEASSGETQLMLQCFSPARPDY